MLNLPARISAQLGSSARIPVMGSLNGQPFRAWLQTADAGRHVLLVNRPLRDAAGARVGTRVKVTIRIDPDPRRVEVPAELAQALAAAPKAQAVFDRLPPSHRREYIGYILEAKRPETRARRVAQTVERLAALEGNE